MQQLQLNISAAVCRLQSDKKVILPNRIDNQRSEHKRRTRLA